MNNRLQIHLIGNAHLDPVWLWNRYEGLSEALSTVRSVLDLMDAYPEMTFVRGEALVYEQVRRWDPESLERIRTHIASGRWDVVGGNWIQPDTNLVGTATLLKEYELGMRWFGEHVDIRPTCAWAADSFGHSAGFPEIYRLAGFDSFVFSRPMEAQLTLPSPLFWWIGRGGARILSYRMENSWYGIERDEMKDRLDVALEAAVKSPLSMAGAFYGLGNHGGGPSARHLEEIRRWADEHPDVDVVHSGLHRLMRVFRERMDSSSWDAPVWEGELNYCLRGCYSSSMRTKLAFRKAEAAVIRAERARTTVTILGQEPSSGPDWKGLCFNAFHDILPGTSIESETVRQIESIHRIRDHADDVVYDNLMRIASNLRVEVPSDWPGDHPLPQPVFAWNPHPWEIKALLDFEVPLDYRPIQVEGVTYGNIPLRVYDDQGGDLPFQRLEPHNAFYKDRTWRMRLAVTLTLPPLGYRVVYVGWWPSHTKPVQLSQGVWAQGGRLVSDSWDVGINTEGTAVSLRYRNQPIFGQSDTLKVLQVRDHYGSWGGPNGHPESDDLQDIVSEWRIVDHRIVEKGPLRSRLWTCWKGPSGSSRMELDLTLNAQTEVVHVAGRVLWIEREGRLKLQLPSGKHVVYEVPGGTVKRGREGEVPGLGFCRIVAENNDAYGLVNDGLSNFNLSENGFQATVVRSTQYACNEPCNSKDEGWKPVHDQGELRFDFGVTPGDLTLWKAARELENPVITLPVARLGGSGPANRNLMGVSPGTVELLNAEPLAGKAGKGFFRITLLNHGPASNVLVEHARGCTEVGFLEAGRLGTYVISV